MGPLQTRIGTWSTELGDIPGVGICPVCLALVVVREAPGHDDPYLSQAVSLSLYLSFSLSHNTAYLRMYTEYGVITQYIQRRGERKPLMRCCDCCCLRWRYRHTAPCPYPNRWKVTSTYKVVRSMGG